MNWWGLLVVVLGALLIIVVVLTHTIDNTRSRMIAARSRAFGRLLGKSGDDGWFARDLRRGTISAALVGVLVIVIGIVMLVHGGKS